MPENFQVRDAAGNTITVAANEISSVKYQLLKLMTGGTAGETYYGFTPPEIDGKDRLALHAAGAMIYQGTGNNWDRMRGNEVRATALASAARTASTYSAQLFNINGRGVIVYLTVTVTGTGTLAVRLNDTNNVFILGEVTGVTGSKQMVFAPGVGQVAGAGAAISGAAVGIRVPRQFLLGVIHSDSSSWTYSLTYDIVL